MKRIKSVAAVIVFATAVAGTTPAFAASSSGGGHGLIGWLAHLFSTDAGGSIDPIG